MNLRIKNKNLSLSDDISPLYRFINARKELKLYYMNNKTNLPIKNLINNNTISNKKKEKILKKPALKYHSVKLLKEQLLLLSHFSKKNGANDFNYEYNTSLLNTFGNRNFFLKNNDKMNINLFTKFSSHNNSKNFFKTTTIKYSKKRNNVLKKHKISYDKIKLPMLNSIIRKYSK